MLATDPTIDPTEQPVLITDIVLGLAVLVVPICVTTLYLIRSRRQRE